MRLIVVTRTPRERSRLERGLARLGARPGRKPPAQLRIDNVTEPASGISRAQHPRRWPQLPPAWVIFGKCTWVILGARRSRPAARPLTTADVCRGVNDATKRKNVVGR